MSDQNVINIENSIKESLRKQLTPGAYEVYLESINTNIIATRIWLDNIIPIIEDKELKIEELEEEIERLNEEKEELESEFEESD